MPDFEDVKRSLSQATRFILIAEMRGAAPCCIACFVEATLPSNFAIGRRHIGSIPTRQLYLLGETVLGELRPETWSLLLAELNRFTPYEFINLGEISTASDLYRAVTSSPARYRVSCWSGEGNVRWLINLPQTFEDYVVSLRSKSRQMVRQSLRKYNGAGSFEVVSRENQVNEFLSVASQINRKTYQWRLGLRIWNDHETQAEYSRLARLGQLRCYVLRIDGEPCAFIRGILVGDIYLYQATGYLPEHRKWSPGKIILMLAIKDLIEAGDCRIFDFGDVGDHVGYKSRFGNVFLPSRRILVSQRFSFRPTLIASAQAFLLALKNISKRIFTTAELRRRVRQLLRT